jgi:hypothetical protein
MSCDRAGVRWRQPNKKSFQIKLGGAEVAPNPRTELSMAALVSNLQVLGVYCQWIRPSGFNCGPRRVRIGRLEEDQALASSNPSDLRHSCGTGIGVSGGY